MKMSEKVKTYNSRYSLVITRLTTNPPLRCLNRAERTESLVVSCPFDTDALDSSVHNSWESGNGNHASQIGSEWSYAPSTLDALHYGTKSGKIYRFLSGKKIKKNDCEKHRRRGVSLHDHQFRFKL